MGKDKVEKKKQKCHICDEIIMGGVAGKDFHYVKAKSGQDRYYCEKCMQKLMRGEI
jgi:hypothetical protein